MDREYVGIRQATQKGYIECEIGGVADFSYPTSKLRRGRVQGGGHVCPTLTSQSMGICRIEKIVRGGGRFPTREVNADLFILIMAILQR